MCFATGVEPTKLMAATSGCSSSRHRHLVAVDDVEHPVGQAGLGKISARSTEAPGSRSDGLRMTALPQAMAFGSIQSGTMHGKLNGVMQATTPTGCRSERTSTPVGDLRRELALQQLRDAAGELDALEAALHLARGVGERLAVLRR